MPDFTWRAATAAGKIEHGQLSAASVAAAQRQLRSQGLTPLHIEASGAASATLNASPPSGTHGLPTPGKVRVNKGPVNSADVLALTSELAIMLRAGLALDNALRVLIDMAAHKPSVRTLVQGILDAVKGGTPLSRALAEHRAFFFRRPPCGR